jgi:D-galactarolactone cycloisomerase
MNEPLHIASLDAFVFRAPLDTPVQTSFGLMHDRPMLLVRAVDRDGATGWGEIWCNFPAVGAEHRARLLTSILRPLLTAGPYASPADAFQHMTLATEVMAIQCAEPGPFAQAIAGVDIALHDLAARRAGQPLWRYLGGRGPRVEVYASGLNPTSPETLASEKHGEGHRSFKLKIGFGRDRDLANLAALRDSLGGDARLMVDANQAWSLDQALAMAPEIERFAIGWLEEPIRADSSWSDWKRLAEATRIPLAAGENLRGSDFDRALASRALRVIQPDIAKWGGFSGCLPLARQILATGHRFCPHYRGGGIGLLASAHYLAAVGGDGLLEIDSNPNPLRSEIAGPLARIVEGQADLGGQPGLGVEDPLGRLERYLVRF